MGNVKVDFKELEQFRDKFTKMQIDAFMEDCAKELAARLLRSVRKKTPVGVYPASSGKKGGNLRRNWTAQKDLKVIRSGSRYVIEIKNPTEYASYVEYGHRTRNHQGWVPGKFFLTMSENDIRSKATPILEAKLNKWLREVLK